MKSRCDARRDSDCDSLYRLTERRQSKSALEVFSYDATGNRLSASDAQGSRVYSYPQDSHRLESVAGAVRDYSEAGNTVQVDGLTLEYSGFNRFEAIPGWGPWGWWEPRQLNTYNGRGEREHRYLSSGQICKGCPGEGHRLFGYDEHGRLLFDTEGDTPRHKILWLDDQPIALAVAHGAYAGEVLHIHADHLGSPRAITRPAAGNAVVWRWRLEGSTFGQHPAEADPDGDGVSLEFNLRYPGQYFDSSTGWHYNYFRDYEPATGRYLQSDPIGLRGGTAIFAYAAGNTARFFDSLGLEPECIDCDRRISQARVREWCGPGGITTRISDESMAACVRRKCNSGVIQCKKRCMVQCEGDSRPKPGGFAGLAVNGTNRIILCMDSPRENIRRGGGWGAVVVHEFAHHCGWMHCDGGGVPRDHTPAECRRSRSTGKDPQGGRCELVDG